MRGGRSHGVRRSRGSTLFARCVLHNGTGMSSTGTPAPTTIVDIVCLAAWQPVHARVYVVASLSEAVALTLRTRVLSSLSERFRHSGALTMSGCRRAWHARALALTALDQLQVSSARSALDVWHSLPDCVSGCSSK